MRRYLVQVATFENELSCSLISQVVGKDDS